MLQMLEVSIPILILFTIFLHLPVNGIICMFSSRVESRHYSKRGSTNDFELLYEGNSIVYVVNIPASEQTAGTSPRPSRVTDMYVPAVSFPSVLLGDIAAFNGNDFCSLENEK